jgi:hypothetical protein
MPRNQREGHKLQIAALVRGAPRAGSVLSNRDIGSLEARSRQQLLGKHEGQRAISRRLPLSGRA